MAGNPWPETHGRKPREREGEREGEREVLMKTTVLLAVGGRRGRRLMDDGGLSRKRGESWLAMHGG